MAEVRPGEAVSGADHVNRQVAVSQLRDVLYRVLQLVGFGGDPDRYKRLLELLGVQDRE